MLHLAIPLEHAVHTLQERLSCSAPDCGGTRRLWGRISDRTGSIHIHGHRYCFPVCFEKELRRYFSEIRVSAASVSRPAHRMPLGLLMLSRGELSHEQLRRVLEAQKQSGAGRIGEWMQKFGFVAEQQVTAALAAQWSCPVLRSLPANVPNCGIPFQLLRELSMVPIHYNRQTGIVHLAFASDIEYRVLHSIEQMLECKTEPCLADASAVLGMLAEMEERGRTGDVNFDNVRFPDEATRITSSYAVKLDAMELRLAACGGYAWIRILARNGSTNLLFRRTVKEIVPVPQSEQDLYFSPDIPFAGTSPPSRP